MPRTALRCLAEVNIRAVSCPGVWLPHRDDVYLSIRLLGQSRHTQLVRPSFPLVFNQKFKFDKIFYTAHESSQVVRELEDEFVIIELMQLFPDSHGSVLAQFKTNARDFLCPVHHSLNRTALMDPSYEFPGISPKLEFSTKASIRETSAPTLDLYEDLDRLNSAARSSLYNSRSFSPRRSRRSGKRKRGYRKPTVASVCHSRSSSPFLSRHMESLTLQDEVVDAQPRPPFVVRKVAPQLIGRVPGTLSPRRGRSPTRRPSSPLDHSDLYNYTQEPRSLHAKGGYGTYADDHYLYNPRGRPVLREPADSYYNYCDSSSPFSDPESEDDLLYRQQYRYTDPVLRSRARSPSPRAYRSSVRDRFDDRPWSSVISNRVDTALRRNRSLEKLDRLHSQAYRPTYLDREVDSLDELELDLDLSRNRSMVPMVNGEFWSERASQYRGRSHREIFNSSLGKLHADLYQRARAEYL